MDIREELKLPLIISFSVLIVGSIFTFLGQQDSISISLLTTLLLSVIAFVLSSWVKIFFNIPKILDNRISRMVEFSALWTENSSFEKTLKILQHDYHTKYRVKWLITKFISYKLSKDFKDCSDIEVVIENIEGIEYSILLEKLILECQDEIFMSCPYSPSDWFKTLINKCKETCDKNCECIIDKVLKEIPTHANAVIKNNKVKNKVRLINKEWNQQKREKDIKCRQHFETISKKAKLKNKMLLNDGLLGTRDLNILDGVLIEWDHENKKCILKIGTDEVNLLRRKFTDIAGYNDLPKT